MERSHYLSKLPALSELSRLATVEQLVAGTVLAGTSDVVVARKQAEIDGGIMFGGSWPLI